MQKPDYKQLKKYVRKLNKLNFIEEKIDTKLEYDELIYKFILGMMRVDDLGKNDDISQEMIEFQNKCFDYRESQENQSSENNEDNEEFDRDDLEEKLNEFDFDDLEEYVSDNDLKIEMEEDDFDEKQDDWIEEILDIMEEKSKGKDSSANDELSDYSNLLAKLKAMDFKELKAYIKNDPKLKEEFGLLKKDAFASKDYPTDIVKFISQRNGSEKEDSGIRQKLFKMEFKEVKSFIKENNIDFKVKSKEWKNQETRQNISLKIAELLDKSSDDKPLTKEEIKAKLDKMDFEEMMIFIQEKGIAEKVDPEDFEEDDFDDEKQDIIDEILEALEETFPKKTSQKKPKKIKKGDKSTLRKAGNTYQEIAAEVLKTAKKPLTRAEVAKLVMEKKDDATEKSADNFTNIAIQVAMVFGILEHDESKDTYKMK